MLMAVSGPASPPCQSDSSYLFWIRAYYRAAVANADREQRLNAFSDSCQSDMDPELMHKPASGSALMLMSYFHMLNAWRNITL